MVLSLFLKVNPSQRSNFGDWRPPPCPVRVLRVLPDCLPYSEGFSLMDQFSAFFQAASARGEVRLRTEGRWVSEARLREVKQG